MSLELIVASGVEGNQVMVKLCHRALDGLGMLTEWVLSIVVPIFNGMGDTWFCSCHRATNILELGMKVVQMVLGKQL